MAIKSDAAKIKEAMENSEEIVEVAEESEKKATKKTTKKVEKEEKKLTLMDLPGVGPGAVAKLEAAGIFDLMGLAVLTPPSLSDMAGMGEAAARKAIQAARQMMDLGFSDGLAFKLILFFEYFPNTIGKPFNCIINEYAIILINNHFIF